MWSYEWWPLPLHHRIERNTTTLNLSMARAILDKQDPTYWYSLTYKLPGHCLLCQKKTALNIGNGSNHSKHDKLWNWWEVHILFHFFVNKKLKSHNASDSLWCLKFWNWWEVHIFIPLFVKRTLKCDFLIMLTLVVCNASTLFVEMHGSCTWATRLGEWFISSIHHFMPTHHWSWRKKDKTLWRYIGGWLQTNPKYRAEERFACQWQ